MTISIAADGEDEERAVETLCELISHDFAE